MVIKSGPQESKRRIVFALCAAAIVLPAASPAYAENATWSKLPHMQLQRQFAGPLQDTVIQRWRDPVDGTICYLYLPITAAHSAPTANGYVQYGANTIGSLSCLPGAPERSAGHKAHKKP